MPGLGPVYATPMPQWVGLTDRLDGTVWYLSHDVADQRFGITDSIPSPKQRLGVRVYPALDGPVISWGGPGRPILRLLIRDGRIGYELVALPRGILDRDIAPVTTRKGNGPLVLTIRPLTWLREGDVIGYEVTRDG